MKVDTSVLMHVFITLICLMSFIYAFVYSHKIKQNKIYSLFINHIYKMALGYSKSFTVNQYTAYGKYEIWRFFIHF